MELKPCPFCGGKPKHEDFFDGFFEWCSVECLKCLSAITLPRIDGLDTAVEAWNRRVEEGEKE